MNHTALPDQNRKDKQEKRFPKIFALVVLGAIILVAVIFYFLLQGNIELSFQGPVRRLSAPTTIVGSSESLTSTTTITVTHGTTTFTSFPAPPPPATVKKSASALEMYQDKLYGFEISYPSRLQTVEGGAGVIEGSTLPGHIDPGFERLTYFTGAINISENGTNYPDFADYIVLEILTAGADPFRPITDEPNHIRVTKRANITVGNVPAELKEAEMVSVWTNDRYVPLEQPCPMVQVHFKKGNHTYSLLGSCGPGNDGKYSGTGKQVYRREEFDKMISTFKFLQ